MKIYSLIFIFLSIIISGQIRFEKGYTISDDGQRKDVYIKNMDWSNNPETYIYKITEDGEQKTGQLANTKEFAVPNYFKFIKHTGKIDISSNNINELSDNKNPILTEKMVFLNVVSEGKLNLYLYKSTYVEQFFYSLDNGEIVPLEYKKYNPDGDVYKIAENTKYINQLKELFAQNTPETFKSSKIKYEKKYLAKVFDEYNGKKTESKNNRIDFNLSVRPGISQANFNLDSPQSSNYPKVDFSSKSIFRLGIEAELALPFNKNKWAIVMEPFYYKYKNEAISQDGNYRFQTEFDMLDFEIALRHYMFISKTSKLFLNAGFVANLYTSKDAFITYTGLKAGYLSGGLGFEKNSSYFNFGLGYNYKNKLSAEVKLSTGKSLYDTSYWRADLTRVSFILGYNIF